MNLKDLSVIITTFKSEDKIYSCLDSIPQNVRIFVIENSNNNIPWKNMVYLWKL